MKPVVLHLLVIAFLCPVAFAAEIHVAAAISLSDALNEVGHVYEKQTGNRMIFNFAASSVLARQIEEGAPADLFFSADEEKMNKLETDHLLDESSRRNLLSNVLVAIVPAGSKTVLNSPEDLLRVKGNIAIAEPDSVPAGIYAKEYLTKKGLWDKLQSRLVPTENVRAALSAVESGDADTGIVYKTDAHMTNGVQIAFEVSGADAPKIIYPVAAIRNSGNLKVSVQAISFFTTKTSQDIFRKYGFVVLSQ